MNYKLIKNDVKDILAMLNEEEFPESYALLSAIDNDLVNSETDTYEIASELIECDGNCAFPQYLISFITKLYTCSIEEGNAEAMNDLGAQYYDGNKGFEQDFSKAVHYYNMAAEHGSRQAQENLGYCYYYGRNMPVDYEKAFHYFALGAFDGHLISLYKIGDMYAAGHYVKKNEVEAFHIYQRCLETMTDEAAQTVAGPVFLRLGKMYLYGYGTDKDIKSALVCYQKAESFLFDMVKNGNAMYRKSLMAAIDGQEKARSELLSSLPQNKWLDGVQN